MSQSTVFSHVVWFFSVEHVLLSNTDEASCSLPQNRGFFGIVNCDLLVTRQTLYQLSYSGLMIGKWYKNHRAITTVRYLIQDVCYILSRHTFCTCKLWPPAMTLIFKWRLKHLFCTFFLIGVHLCGLLVLSPDIWEIRHRHKNVTYMYRQIDRWTDRYTALTCIHLIIWAGDIASIQRFHYHFSSYATLCIQLYFWFQVFISFFCGWRKVGWHGSR